MAEYRPTWWPEQDGRAASVLMLAQSLHEHNTGSSDPLSDHEQVVRCLRWVRDHWKQPSSMYDRAVLTLVVRALAEDEGKYKPSDAPPDIVCKRG